MSPVVFLLGAGASMDAGMPSVAELTQELRNRLPELCDIEGNPRPEFAELFDALAEYDTDEHEFEKYNVKYDYEQFFEWLVFLYRCQNKPFNRVARLNLDARLIAAAGPLCFVINRPILSILRSRHTCASYNPEYFAKLGAFIPEGSRLKVFTTNYDLCVEDACRAKGIKVITGFEPPNGRWNSSRFQEDGTGGINVYKLHGSLNRGLQSGLKSRRAERLIERYPPAWDKVPELLLGPGPKLQHDEPYVTLYSEFHQALRDAKVCVAIGCGFRDKHIKEPLGEANCRGMRVIDVNPSPNYLGYFLPNYENINTGARKALESGVLFQRVSRVLNKRA